MGVRAFNLTRVSAHPMDIAPYVAAIRRCFPAFVVEHARPTQQGWDSAVLEVNGAWIFRFPLRPEVEAAHRREIALLPELAEALPAAIPDLAFIWSGGPEYATPFIGYRRIGGVPLRRPLPAKTRSRLAGQLAAFLAALHRFPTARAAALTGLADGAAAWRTESEAVYTIMRERVIPLLNADARVAATALFEHHLADETHFSFRPVVIHHDLGPEHILVDPQNRDLAGVIDWSDLIIGDPAIDLAALIHLDQSFARAVMARYLEARAGEDVPGEKLDGLWQRASFYGKVGPFWEVLHGLDSNQPRYIESGITGVLARLQG